MSAGGAGVSGAPAAPAAAAGPRALISLDEALARLAEGTRPYAFGRAAGDVEEVSTFEALGRVLAEEVRSQLDVPPADNTSMDGYALRAADVPAAGTVLPVAQRIAAGLVGGPLVPGSAARIFTGAPVPAGADVVVMQEQCEALAPSAGTGNRGAVRINVVPEAGQWIRRRGEDVQCGAVVLARGARLTPQALGLAASVGAGLLSVVRRPRVAVFSTGDELVMPGEPLKPGAIYNSNRFTLRGLLQAAGCAVSDFGIVPDNLQATRDALRAAAAAHDLIVTSGGVSVGEEDHLRPAVMAEGRIENWQIAMKPGKPLAFGAVRRSGASAGGQGGSAGAAGSGAGEALFVGLPGNPVSSFVTFMLCVGTVLRTLQGMAGALPRPLMVPAGFDWPRADKRREFVRVRVGAQGRLELFANQSSGVLTSAVWADGLVDIAPGRTVQAGEPVPYLALADLIAR